MVGQNESEDIVVREEQDMMQLYQESVASILGPEGMSLDLIPRITLKHAGAVGFGIESIEGEEELISGAKGFDGVILHMHLFRVYWDKPFEERDEKNPFPACSSKDGITGWWREEEKEALCRQCPWSQWGSARSGEGQACAKKARLFILPKDNILPHVLDAPTTSVQEPQHHSLMLFGKKLAYWQVVTHFGAKKAINRQGIEYTKLVLSLASQLEPEAVAELQAMRDSCAQASMRMPLETSESNDEFAASDNGEEVFE